MLKRVLPRTAVVLIVIGIIWMLQGMGVLPGSFMSGQRPWVYRGGGLAIVGLLILRFTRPTRGTGTRA